MTHRPKSTLILSLTIALIALAVASASGNKLSISSQPFRVAWTSLELTNTARPEGTVRCAVTLEGSFHSATISKVTGALIGYVSTASVNGASCTGGRATIFNTSLPWHIRYRGFSGTLPDITSITVGLIGAEFQIQESGGQVCKAKTEPLEPAIGAIRLNETTHKAETLTPESNARIRLSGGTFEICALARGAFSGASQAPTQLGSTAEIEVTLIGEPTPPVRLEPSPVVFGRLEPSQLSLRTVTIIAGSAGNTVNRISMERANYFAITDPNRCIGTRLAENARCSFKAVFVAPAEAERRLTDTITVEATDGNVRDTVEGST